MLKKDKLDTSERQISHRNGQLWKILTNLRKYQYIFRYIRQVEVKKTLMDEHVIYKIRKKKQELYMSVNCDFFSNIKKVFSESWVSSLNSAFKEK